MTLIDVCSLCHPSAGVVARSDLWTMVVNENQTLLGRCYFALNRHETDATCLTESEQIALFDYLKRSKAALDSCFSPDHYNYVMLMNLEPHVHAHIIPRYRTEREFGEEKFADMCFGEHYDPDASQMLSAELFKALVSAIEAQMARKDDA